jgi:hypothetical protein
MAEAPTYNWEGKSGKKYPYYVYPIGTSFKPISGNYIFAKPAASNTWDPLYVGETDNLEQRLTPNHEKMPCVKRYGGTHVHVHNGSHDKATRRDEEADIREKWEPPCNLED